MDTSGSSGFDFLRRRRKEYGSINKKKTPVDVLRLRGLIIGCGIVSLSILLCITTSVTLISITKEQRQLEKDSIEFDSLVKEFKNELKILKSIYSVNKEIASGISSIRSGSAILSELKTNVPTSIQFKTISTNDKSLTITGVLPQPKALESINAFKLKIEGSPFFDERNTLLVNAKQLINNNYFLPYMQFEISSLFSKDNTDQIINHLDILGSAGILYRVKLMKEEGLIE